MEEVKVMHGLATGLWLKRTIMISLRWHLKFEGNHRFTIFYKGVIRSKPSMAEVSVRIYHIFI